jgi:SAM-dependent methyltransferase
MAVGTVTTTGYFETRLEFDPRRRVLWQTLYRYYFKALVKPSDSVVDLGCGHGEFINAVEAKRRIAIDQWDGFTKFVDPAVETHVGSITDLSMLSGDSVDVAFASNVFEHLTTAECGKVLEQLRVKLRRSGSLILVQPNYRYAYREYFDDYTHVTAYSHVSLCDFLAANGFAVTRCVPKFMPLTIKSRFKVSPWLIRAYLASPVKPLAKQMLVIATPR